MWQKFAFTVVLVASFVLLYQKDSFKKLTTSLRFYGKMSLTNYISQSIMGAIIYFRSVYTWLLIADIPSVC